ncbi:MAG: hypothetical protein ACFB14_01575 [Leptolyngbyaceae cyanobacterium]
MSNSPELTPKTSSSAKNLLRRFKHLITSPYGVAAIASLSFHGALFAAMPRFSEASFAAFNEENAEAEARTVPLVTLAAADQERLPDFNRPQLPAIPNLNSAPPANLPNASTFNRSNIPSIFNRSGSGLTSPSLGSPNNLSRNRPFQNPYIPRPRLSIRNTPSRSSRSSDNRTATIIDIPQPPPSILQGTETDEDTLRRELEIEAQQQAAADQAEPAEDLPDLPDQTEQSEEETVSENPEDIAANSETTNQPTQLERLQAKFNYDEANTTSEEVEANYEEWETQTDENSDGAVETAELLELTLEPGFRLCAQNPPTNGVIGILVAPDGTPSDPAILRSTGYEYLNKAALETLMATDFPETEQPVRYPFEIIINYDDAACKSAEEILETVQSTAESSEAEQSEAEQPETEQPEAEQPEAE